MATRLWTAGGRAERARGAAVDWRVAGLIGTAVLAAAIAWSMGPVGQDQHYFEFVDDRTLLGVPKALNVLSNAAFLAAGVAGLLLVLSGRAAFRDRRERWPWLVLFLGVALTTFGSAWFHLNPSDDSLVWDRLPMTIGFMGLLSALLSERIDPGVGLRLLGPLVAAGIGSVVAWIWSGDLRAYLLVQYYPVAAILLVLALFRPAYTGTAAWLVAFGAYAAAKWAEAADGPVYAALRVVSGHTVKHVLAAAGIAVLAVMLARRRALAAPAPDAP